MTFDEQIKQENNPSILRICEYLKTRKDMIAKLENPKKSIKDMWNYIVSEAKKKAKNNCACISDEEVFGMAVHYYDESNVGSPESIPTVKKSEIVKPKKEKKKKEPEFIQETLF